MFRISSFILLVAALPVLAEPTEIPKPSANAPGEKLLKAWSQEKAAKFLDGVAVNWTREKSCGTCHTNYPYLIARPLLSPAGDPGPEWKEVRGFFENRAANWDKAKPRWDAEVVATAACLAISDGLTSKKLNPVTKKALDRMWALQGKDGGWTWLKCNWPPFEHDDYFGALYAAVGVGYAPERYQESASARAGVEKLKQYFARHPAPDLHHKTWLLWASVRVNGILTPEEQRKAVDQLLAKQRPDGGWCLPSLGGWKRHDGSPNDPDSASDGYATGLAVFVLRQAGVAKDHETVRKGISWLKTHQAETGRWFTRSLNHDRAHYITNAGTAFAVMALKECE
jgi:squalene-hopene/tetraprenyl-beta-curcumene cyclase